MHPDDVGGQPQLVLDATHQALGGHQHAQHGQRLDRPVGAPAALEQPHRDHRHPEQRGDRGVAVDHPAQGVVALEREPMHPVADGPARVWPGGGRRGAREDCDRPERRERPHGPHAEAVPRARPGARLKRGSPRERHRRDQHDHRQREVAHDEAGGQVLADGEPAEHRLSEDPDGERQRQPHQVAPERSPEEGEREREDRDHPDQPGDGPVGVLDHRVRGERRQRLAVALGPVGAAQTGVGEPHRGARQHDHRQRGERDVRDPAVLRGGEAETASHQPEMLLALRRTPSRQRLEVRIDHPRDQLLEAERVIPAEPIPGARGIPHLWRLLG